MIEVVENENVINYPYAVISDVHLHCWSQFSHTLPNGRNNRLQQILDGIEQVATHLLKLGGNDLVITGDLFHTRGSVKPSVLNPTIDLFTDLTCRGINVHGIPGNHDLEGINSDTLGNALHSLSSIPSFNCYTSPTQLASDHLFIPWYEDSRKVLNLATKRAYQKPKLTLFAHVGLSGVVPAAIGNTLDPSSFLKEDFKYVFCGHFHNHVAFDARVYSVGALTHQTWSDVGSKAGYLIVYEDRVEHYETNAPKFVEQTESDWVNSRSRGNYVRFRDIELDAVAAADLVKGHLSPLIGALAVLDQSTRPTIVDKSYVSPISMDLGIDKALQAYCENTFGENWKAVYEECLKLKS
jgi:DNA repair exonuclease SbcCD nuclease subunit